MSLDEYRGAAWAFAELMKRAKADMARGQTRRQESSPRAPTHERFISVCSRPGCCGVRLAGVGSDYKPSF
jgi:hypothetical protein